MKTQNFGKKQCKNCREFVGVRSTKCVNYNSLIKEESSDIQFTPNQLKAIFDVADFESTRIKKEWEEASNLFRKGLGIEERKIN